MKNIVYLTAAKKLLVNVQKCSNLVNRIGERQFWKGHSLLAGFGGRISARRNLHKNITKNNFSEFSVSNSIFDFRNCMARVINVFKIRGRQNEARPEPGRSLRESA